MMRADLERGVGAFALGERAGLDDQLRRANRDHVAQIQAVPARLIDSGLVGSTDLGGVPREQKMLTGHLPRVIHHQVY